jgi:tetratricopeptide (TPR) repeat protein
MDKNINNNNISFLNMTKKTDAYENKIISKKDAKDEKEKYEILSRIADLEILARKAMMIGNYEEAIENSEKIIRLSIVGDLSHFIDEQQTFLNEIAYKVHKEYTTKEINAVGNGIRKIYETLIKSEKIKEAHNILKDFKENYNDISYFNTVPLIQELLARDTRLWMKYQLSLDEGKSSPERQEIHDVDDDIEEIKKFLKKV